MKKILSILALSVLAIGAKAQVLEQVKYKHQADVIVRFVYNKYQADAVVYEGYKYEARKQAGVWHYSNNDPYRVKIYVTEYAHEADINVFVALNKWEVKTDGYYNELFYKNKN